MVSWFVKQALLNIAADTNLDAGLDAGAPAGREDWARLMQRLGVKGIHIAERDTQRAREPRPMNQFWNTWSVEGFISEGLQPAELGWGTHERWKPDNAQGFDDGCQARAEEHTSELQSLMRISYAVFCFQKNKKTTKLHK